MEPVAAETEVHDPVPWERVERGWLRQASMECGVEAGHMGEVRAKIPEDVQDRQRGAVVQRSELHDRGQPTPNAVVDDRGLAKLRSAVHQAVSDGFDRPGMLDEVP